MSKDLEQKAEEIIRHVLLLYPASAAGKGIKEAIVKALADVREADAKVVRAIASNRLQEGWGASYALSLEEAADAILAQGVKP